MCPELPHKYAEDISYANTIKKQQKQHTNIQHIWHTTSKGTYK